MPQLDLYLENLSSAQPVPGGGSVAALEAAMAASLVAMVANLTLRSKRLPERHPEVAAIRDRAVALRDQAQDLAAADEVAFSLVSAAMALPRQSEAERSVRQERLQEALKGAVDPPERTMDLTLQVLGLCDQMVEVAASFAVSDLGVAAASCRAAHLSARLNVDINLVSVRDRAWVAQVEGRIGPDTRVDDLTAGVLERVRQIIQSKAS